MPKGPDGSIIHYAGIRMRVVGSGNLQLRFISLDQILENVLVPLVMSPTTQLQPTRLGNFTQQGAQLEGKIEELNEYFKINKIVIYAKKVASEFPA